MIDTAVFWSSIKATHGLSGAGEQGADGREPAYGVIRASDGKYVAVGS